MHMDLVYIQKSFIVTTQHISSIELSSGMAGRCAKDRGGVQQKNKRCREEDGAESGLAQYLVEETVWGHLSAPAIQRVAALADADVTRALASRTPGFRYDSLQRLASLGSSGIYPNICGPS